MTIDIGLQGAQGTTSNGLAVVGGGSPIELTDLVGDEDVNEGRGNDAFCVSMNMPDIYNESDALGRPDLRSPRIQFEFTGRVYNGAPDFVALFLVGDDELTKQIGGEEGGKKQWGPIYTADSFLAYIRASNRPGMDCGLDRRIEQKIRGLHWNGREAVSIPGVDAAHPAYRYAVVGYDRMKGDTRGRAVVPAHMIVEAINSLKVVARGRSTIQALNIRTENAGTPQQAFVPGRLIVAVDPLFKRGEGGKRDAKNGVEKQGLIVLLDDPRFGELSWQIPSVMDRMRPTVRALSGYPFTPRMSAEERAAASDRFAQEFWASAALMHSTGTPLGGQGLVAFLGSQPNLFTVEHLQAELSECVRIIQAPGSSPEEKEGATATWHNLRNLCTAMATFMTAVNAKADERRKSLGDGKVNGQPQQPAVVGANAQAAAPPPVSATAPAAEAPVEATHVG